MSNKLNETENVLFLNTVVLQHRLVITGNY